MSEAVDPRAAIRLERGGLALRVRLTPKSSRDAVGEPFETADGAANAALVRLLADVLDVAKSKVEVVAGHSSRVKTVRISADADAAAKRLAGLAAKAE